MTAVLTHRTNARPRRDAPDAHGWAVTNHVRGRLEIWSARCVAFLCGITVAVAADAAFEIRPRQLLLHILPAALLGAGLVAFIAWHTRHAAGGLDDRLEANRRAILSVAGAVKHLAGRDDPCLGELERLRDEIGALRRQLAEEMVRVAAAAKDAALDLYLKDAEGIYRAGLEEGQRRGPDADAETG